MEDKEKEKDLEEIDLTDSELLAEGKTKRIWSLNLDKYVVCESKDDITAGDGAKHDIVEGKGALSNQTTCNVFRFLNDCGIPTSFKVQIDETRFLATKCEMIPYEVVVRREAHGSYLMRAPWLQKGHLFPKLIVEFYLKTSGKKWGDYDLICDDPLVIFDDANDQVKLYSPKLPISQQEPFLVLDEYPLKDMLIYRKKIEEIARQAFLALEKAWQLLGRKLVDIKFEFGLKPGTFDRLVLSDVVDNDSWRVLEDEKYIDKQGYRDGEDINTVTANYQKVAELTKQFSIPRQQLVFWVGSSKDDLHRFYEALDNIVEIERDKLSVKITDVECSVHKSPVEAYESVTQLVQEVPDSVVIAYVGRSNGAGPVLSAAVTVPVIAVPATWKEFPEDVWSSLRMPSDVPLMTVLEPKNAVLAALQILAMRNPKLYAQLRMKQEERLTNIIEI